MPSYDDIYFYKLSTKRVLNFTTFYVLLSTILNLRGQNVDKWQFSVNFHVDKILANPYISYYLPQHCLYFFPEPHGHGSFLPTLFDFLWIFLVSFPPLSAVGFSTCFLSKFCPPSLGFSRQEHWSGLPFPSPVHESEK